MRLYTQEYLSIHVIAARLFIGPTWVRNALLRNNVRMRKRGGTHHYLPQAEVVRTMELYTSGGIGGYGMTLAEVAEVLDITHSSVAERLESAGIDRRSRAEQQELQEKRRLFMRAQEAKEAPFREPPPGTSNNTNNTNN